VSGEASFDAYLAARNPMKILLAEDNIINQKLAIRILERMGYRVDIAANGLEALRSLERQRYDLILMDVQMPEMDGLQATRAIRAKFPPNMQPQIVAMTANAMQGDREMCLEAGMNDYVSKPIQVKELVAALQRAAQKRQ
jgi:CheY-like chemotaxis protein